MVNEVNKLIYNSLLKFSAVHLPHIGTLHVKRSAATLEGRTVKAPIMHIDFSSSAEARSLVDIIMDECSVGVGEAEEIYARWFNKVNLGSITTIEGVGTLRNKSFITDPTLLARLNEYAIANLRLPRKGSALKAFAAVASVLIIIAIATFTYINFAGISLPNFAENSGVVADASTPASEPESKSDAVVEQSLTETLELPAEELAEVEPEVVVEEVIEAVVAQPEIGYMVVIGSFQTEENAERYCAQVERKTNDVNCRIRTLGRLYAVIAYISEDKDDCQEFISHHIEQFPQAWIHTPRELK